MGKFTRLLVSAFLLLTLLVTTNQLILVQGEGLGPPAEKPVKLKATEHLLLGQTGRSVETAGYGTIASIIDVAIRFLFIGGMVAFMLLIIISGYKLIANTDKERELSSLKTNLTNGVIGLIVLAAAWWIVEFFQKSLGININNFK